MSDEPCENTDQELWRARDGDYYADSIHVTQKGGIGINCGGLVFVKSLRQWHALAAENAALTERLRELNAEVSRLYACRNELQDVTHAMDDPAVNNARTLEDAIHVLKRDAARYRWVHDNIEWVDGIGYVLTLHPDATGCVMFGWGVDSAMQERTP